MPVPVHLPTTGLTLALVAFASGACSGQSANRMSGGSPTAGEAGVGQVDGGIDARGIPRYLTRTYNSHDRELLLTAYGVDDPQWLYLSDSGEAGILKYDSKGKLCRMCYVDSYRIGFLSVRRPGELWDDFESRVRHMRKLDFPASVRIPDISLDRLDPDAQPLFAALLDSARRAGFRVSVVETYRSPLREALLFAEGHGRTYTATSMHSYGRAIDVVIGDGRLGHPATRAAWIRFRHFVAETPAGRFRLIGGLDRTWDWRHIEVAQPRIGFHTIDDALDYAARCTTDSARANPPSVAQLGGGAPDPCVLVPHLPQTILGPVANRLAR